METLHAPWRIQYILAPKPSPAEQSIFTQIAHSNDDEANYVIARDRTCYAVLNMYPYTGGHLLVVPYKQTPDLDGLTDEELADLWKLTRRCLNALALAMKPDGFNIGINLGKSAGAGIMEHLAHPRRAALERRHQFHARHRQHHRPARSLGGPGGQTARHPRSMNFSFYIFNF